MSPAPGLDAAEPVDDDFQIDLSDTQEASFEPLPAGIYAVEIDDAEAVTAKTSGNPMIKVTFTVTEEPYENRKLFHNWMLTEQGKPYLKRYLNNLGFTSESFNVAELVQELPGMTCRVKVRKKNYEGEMVNNVTDVLAPLGGSASSDADLPA